MTSARNSRRASGSRLATGSSSTSSSGRLPMASVSASCERWPPESSPARWSRSRPSRSIRSVGQSPVPPGFSVRTEAQVVGDRQRPVQRARPGRRTRPGRAVGVGARAAAEHLERCPRSGSSSPTARCRSVDLPAPFGPDQADHGPSGTRRCSPAAPTAARSACPGPRRRSRCHATPSSEAARKVLSNSAAMLSSSSPARRALRQPTAQIRPQRLVRGERRVRQRPGDERAEPGPAGGEPLVLELAVRLEHGVRVDRHLADHVLDRRELVALVAAARGAGPGAPAGRAAGTAAPPSAGRCGTRSPNPPFN